MQQHVGSLHVVRDARAKHTCCQGASCKSCCHVCAADAWCTCGAEHELVSRMCLVVHAVAGVLTCHKHSCHFKMMLFSIFETESKALVFKLGHVAMLSQSNVHALDTEVHNSAKLCIRVALRHFRSSHS